MTVCKTSYAKATKTASFLESYPTLAAFYNAFRALPELQDYFAGPMYSLPINNPQAKFGSHADPNII